MGSLTGRRWRLFDLWNSFAGVSRGRASRARGGAPFLSTAQDPGEHLFPGARCEQEGSRWLTPFLFAAAPTIPFGERFVTTVCRSGPEGVQQTLQPRSRPQVLVGIRTGRRRYGRGPAWASFLIGTSACISSVLVFQLQRRDFSSSAAVRRACARADVTFSTARRRVGGRAAWGAWWVWLMTVGLCF